MTDVSIAESILAAYDSTYRPFVVPQGVASTRWLLAITPTIPRVSPDLASVGCPSTRTRL